MINNKKSFVLYHDYRDVINELSLEEKGELLDLIFNFTDDYNEDILIENKLLKCVFLPIKNQLLRDKEKYESVVEFRKLAGSKGGIAKVANATIATKKVAKGSKAKKGIANVADTVTVNDTEICNMLNDNGSVNDIFNEQDFTNDEITQINKFLKYKKEKKQSYTKTGLEGLHEQLLEFKTKNYSIIEIIKTSISRNYSGLFEPKKQFNNNTTKTIQQTLKDCNANFVEGDF